MTDTDFSSPFAGPGGQNRPEAEADTALADLEQKLATALAEAEKLREDWLRAKAESENIRRRATEDVAKAHRYGVEGFAAALLAVKDSLDAALVVENSSIVPQPGRKPPLIDADTGPSNSVAHQMYKDGAEPRVQVEAPETDAAEADKA